jgi:hypothetical protein
MNWSINVWLQWLKKRLPSAATHYQDIKVKVIQGAWSANQKILNRNCTGQVDGWRFFSSSFLKFFQNKVRSAAPRWHLQWHSWRLVVNLQELHCRAPYIFIQKHPNSNSCTTTTYAQGSVRINGWPVGLFCTAKKADVMLMPVRRPSKWKP